MSVIFQLHMSRGGYLIKEKVNAKFPDNFWIGPSRVSWRLFCKFTNSVVGNDVNSKFFHLGRPDSAWSEIRAVYEKG